MTTTAHEDQFTAGTQTIQPVLQPYSTEAILRRNIADAKKEMQRQAELAESYADAMRSLASYVGAGGYNADVVDAGVFEEKIRWGIDEIMARTEKVAPDCRACANRGRINGLSQEFYCNSCVYEGRGWRQNHFVDASKMVDTAKRRCEACAILPCSCK